MAGLARTCWHMLLRGWGFEGRRNFWKQKQIRKTTASPQNVWNVGGKIPLQKGASEDNQASESKKAKGLGFHLTLRFLPFEL